MHGSPTAPRRKWLITRTVILCAMGIVLFPILASEAPREIARWHQAAAMEDYLDKDYAAAIQHLNDSMRWDPQSVSLYLLRAQLKRRDSQMVASLKDCDAAVQLMPDSVGPYLQRSQILQDMGRHPEAVADAKKVEELSRQNWPLSHAVALNNLAYFRAVAGIELQEALTDVELALQARVAEPTFLDTRGFIHYRLGNLASARKDLDAAIQQTEDQYKRNYGNMERMRHVMFDFRQFEIQKDSDSRNLAVLHYHRALILRKLNKMELVTQDLERVKELGLDPSEQLY